MRELASEKNPLEQHADAVVLTACALADTAVPDGWSPGAVEDVATALEVLAGALAQRDPESAEILALIPTAVAALRERTEQQAQGVGERTRDGAGATTELRRALGVHRVAGRVYQLGAALITVTLDAADAQALAVLLAQPDNQHPHAAAREAEWGAGPAATAAAALGETLTAYGPSTYARTLDSGQVTAGMSPEAAQQLAATLTAKEAGGKGRRRGLGHGWKGVGATTRPR
ncbi:hypothetical protein I5Q34_26545 [Streptomyces sp. AV19]|uniref:hypothetical protein n=1 Tax=Streptomyces sp. AV19 TaxID=2793068 RepID=UPI0018FEF83E|nr:hypothetical protein [Streptomyces sp. AV19]MBH1937789.1 hypothetical protein [Streptomyces sp. AV19]MDG4537065.1 hypothetical protein [Streptomyces sp. AV19]